MNHAFAVPEAPSSHRRARPPSTALPRVLLAEDDAEMRAMIGAVLRGDGYDVVEARDGADLLEWIANAYLAGDPADAFDLLVADVRMPVCTGLEVLEGMRGARWRTPAILMTAFPDEATRIRSRALGALLFDKPFDVDDLRAAAVDLILQRAPGSSRAREPLPELPLSELDFEDEADTQPGFRSKHEGAKDG